MNTFKKWIARLFNIRPEDLQAQEEKKAASPLNEELDNKIQQEVNRQVREQLQQMLQDVVIPELQNAIKPSSQSPVEVSTPEGKVEKTQPVVIKPVIQPTQTPSDISFNDEFPEIKEDEDVFLLFETDYEIQQEPDVIELEKDQVIRPIGVEEEEDILPLDEISPDEEILPLEEVFTEPESLEEPHYQPVEGKGIRIGIDFGTTTTAISIKIGDERAEALPIGNDGITRYIPSVVYFQPGPGSLQKRAIVGEDAEAFSDQAKVIRSIKRCIGCPENNCRGNLLVNDGAPLPFSWCRANGIVHLSENETLEPEKVAYLIVREALQRAIKVVRERRQIDLTIENVCFLPLNLGCGANFDLTQREVILSIAEELGFQNVKLDNVVEEPILAGFAFSRFVEKPEGRALIYDFGGGTFDVAVMDVDRVNDKLRVTVVSTAGDNWLGGDDIDNLIYRHFLNNVADEVHYPVNVVEDMLGSIDRGRLRLLSRRAKEALSSNDDYSDSLFTTNLGPINLEISREEFESIIRNSKIIERSFNAATRACRLAFAYDCAKQQGNVDAATVTRHKLTEAARTIDRVILVGGVTKIPVIRQDLVRIFGEGKIVQETVIEPVSAVSIGAAYDLDPDHYSISYPPYEICLEYTLVGSGTTLRKTLLQPYEFLDFHKLWVTSSAAIYFKDLPFIDDCINVKLLYRKAGGADQYETLKGLGNLQAANLRFSISMAGMMRLEKIGDNGPAILITEYPVIHPIQRIIREERDKKIKQMQEEESKKHGSYEDMVRQMRTDK